MFELPKAPWQSSLLFEFDFMKKFNLDLMLFILDQYNGIYDGTLFTMCNKHYPLSDQYKLNKSC